MGIYFLFWLVFAAICDAIYRKCFNWVVILGLGMAFISVVFIPESHPVSITVNNSLLGLFAGFLGLIIFYQLNFMSAGDVKFSAVLGAWVGWELLLVIWVVSCGFAVIHGVIVRSNLMKFSSLLMVSSVEPEMKRKKFVPYVTYLSMATVMVLMLGK
ncbi:MAG: prepilin peptidase [Comamonas sp.]|nr:prepilin peptidase [Comamonas sp.]